MSLTELHSLACKHGWTADSKLSASEYIDSICSSRTLNLTEGITPLNDLNTKHKSIPDVVEAVINIASRSGERGHQMTEVQFNDPEVKKIQHVVAAALNYYAEATEQALAINLSETNVLVSRTLNSCAELMRNEASRIMADNSKEAADSPWSYEKELELHLAIEIVRQLRACKSSQLEYLPASNEVTDHQIQEFLNYRDALEIALSELLFILDPNGGYNSVNGKELIDQANLLISKRRNDG
ncbi:hypothetical protein [Neptuniibacter sp. QD37_11]|uniref:hypothetical protein n=1 Tax=Neptuniibacter sp. QD37_11 TaxID=3398209 RepID=UPI0039F48431